MEILKVSSKSNPNAVAGALAGVVRQYGAAEVQVVGAGALNQAVKAIAIARMYLEASEVDLVCTPSFADVEIDGQDRTALRLTLDDRARRPGGIAVHADGDGHPVRAGSDGDGHGPTELISTIS